MKTSTSLPLLAAFTVMAAALAVAQNEGKQPKGERGNKGKGAGPGGQVEPAVVPPYLFNVWLCRPGAESVTLSVLAWKDMEAFVSYGASPAALTQRSAVVKLAAGEPQTIVLGPLKPDTAYVYQLTYRIGGGEAVRDEVRSFHTQRAPASAFTFTMQADSHLDMSTDVRVYQQTLANMLADKPDFMIDLGDTTMVDKFGSFYTRAESQYKAQRFYLGRIAHSVPVLLTLGNHDGEQGFRLTGQPDSMPLWSIAMRKKYFPNPEPGGIYTGNPKPEEGAGMLQDYYAFEWGSALFVVLDPFWFTRERKSEDNWDMTLGEEQYRWLTKTLEASKAPLKFVFLHHLVGGLGKDVRGAVTPAPYMEWGGKNADGSEGFKQHRPGWAMPIHKLLVKNGVSIVFHGHDHLFAKEELDGVIYQEVPQPGHPSGGTRSAEEYGYTGTILGSSGHVRVMVGPGEAQVDYVRSIVPGVTRDEVPNGSVAHSYKIKRK
ncbi:purple acid phosphatase family protein [Prosthecobacter vanneervenii]|uniref:Putative phosphodiesterase n=1 Tax=Prosthecobacter vanneervenii TaxID=48466 RepID=A0A7W7YFA5_9BACT|nr:metallophosphoesterase family protein [Prosthecobacter vanneervenii]MBB5035123.1 putative phosphodiesterase [Prosthecobacter vanneervenii]